MVNVIITKHTSFHPPPPTILPQVHSRFARWVWCENFFLFVYNCKKLYFALEDIDVILRSE